MGVAMMLFFAFGLPSGEQRKQWGENISNKLQMHKMTKSELEEIPQHLRDVYNDTLGVSTAFALIGRYVNSDTLRSLRRCS